MGRRDLKSQALVTVALDDPDAERVRQSHARAIRDLQDQPRPRRVLNVVLPAGVETAVQHGLGRRPTIVLVSPVRAAGAVTAGVIAHYPDVTPSGRNVDRTTHLVLIATGYGTTVTIDLEVS